MESWSNNDRNKLMPKFTLSGTALVIAVGCSVVVLVLFGTSFSLPEYDSLYENWKLHQSRNQEASLSVYTKDRSRLFSGQVRNDSGEVVANAKVVVGCLGNTISARDNLVAFLNDSVFIEQSSVTNTEGYFEFPDLSIGSKMLFVIADGYSPYCSPHKIVQDGYGSRTDVYLENQVDRQVSVRWNVEELQPENIYLVPFGWTTEFPKGVVGSVLDPVSFTVDKVNATGFLVASVKNEGSSLTHFVCGLYNCTNGDCDVSATECLTFANFLERIRELGSEENTLWRNFTYRHNCDTSWSTHETLLFAMPVSPVGVIANFVPPPEAVISQKTPDGPAIAITGEVHGFTPTPFSPVMIEGEQKSYVAFSSAASEFHVPNVEPGAYRVKCMAWGGDCCFSNGVSVLPGKRHKTSFSRLSIIDRSDLDSRQINGFVRDGNGKAISKANVVVQHAADFRTFLRSVETDDEGFFRFTSVPANSVYFIFAVSPNHKQPLRNFQYFPVGQDDREVVQDLVVYDAAIMTGSPVDSNVGLQLWLLSNDGVQQKVVWWNRELTENGQIQIQGIPPGIYAFFIEADELNTMQTKVSETFEVTATSTVVDVKWTSNANAVVN